MSAEPPAPNARALTLFSISPGAWDQGVRAGYAPRYITYLRTAVRDEEKVGRDRMASSQGGADGLSAAAAEAAARTAKAEQEAWEAIKGSLPDSVRQMF
jgi:hypothetical protein